MKENTVNVLLDTLTLTPDADKVSQSYSGGNKRKLSLGIALIGNPSVLIVDEASSGMDPSARRAIWDLITEASNDRAVILTTHSMEEAEALCTRVAILINGTMKCLGSVQYLKNKFLGGYTIDINCKSKASKPIIDTVERRILEMLPGSYIAERHGRFLKVEIPFTSTITNPLKLGGIFRILHETMLDTSLLIEAYSLQQSSIEKIFLDLVKAEEETTLLDSLMTNDSLFV